MSPYYLLSLNYSLMVTKVIELPLCILPGWLCRMLLLEPMACQSLGSVEAAVIAKHRGWAVNLGGGFHHASRNRGSGFCVYPDITFVTHYMEKWYGMKKFMIIDLDAHQGNGHEHDHSDPTRHFIVDAYNHNIFPGDEPAKKNITSDINVRSFTTDDEFLRDVETSLKRAFDLFKPDFIIYNAGTDCMVGDPLGGL